MKSDDPGWVFPVFCHISEFRLQGYENLHRLIAASRPLILWAPSGTLIQHYFEQGITKVEPKELLAYVESGDVRIIGRGPWLVDRAFREQHSWEWAQWSTTFDEPLRAICREDEGLPANERRVSAVESEDGYAWADRILEEQPDRIEQVWPLIRRGRVPAGTLERIGGADEGHKGRAVREVLRDTRNHTRAFELSGASTVALSDRYGSFLRLLEKGVRPGHVRRARLGTAPTQAVVDSTIHLLQKLDDFRPHDSLASFVGSETHVELSSWMSAIARNSGHVKLPAFDKYLIARLREQIETGQVRTGWAKALALPEGRFERTAASVGWVVVIVGFTLDPTGTLGIAGISVRAIPVLTGLSRRLGLIKPNFTGPQWPFLYAFGKSFDAENARLLMERLAEDSPKQPR